MQIRLCFASEAPDAPTQQMEKTMRKFMISILMMLGFMFAGTAIASADPITIGGITVDAPAEIASPVNQQIAAVDQALGNAMPASLPEMAVGVGEAVFDPITPLITSKEVLEPEQPLTTSAPLSEQWDQATEYFVPQYIAPDHSSCTESGELVLQAECSSAHVNDWYADNGYGDAPQAVIVPEYGAGIWVNPQTGLMCGYISGLGAHNCDNMTFYDKVLGPMENDNVAVAVGIHEAGHDLQEGTGSLDPVGATLPAMVGINPAAVFPMEQSSDCHSGAYYHQAIIDGTATEAEAHEAHEFFRSIGHEGELSHGSPDQRGDAWTVGYEQGISACNGFTPGVTVY